MERSWVGGAIPGRKTIVVLSRWSFRCVFPVIRCSKRRGWHPERNAEGPQQ